MRLTRLLIPLFVLGTAFVADLGAQAVVGPRSSGIPIDGAGDTIIVPVVVDMAGSGGASLGSITARLTWRAPILRFLGVSPGTFGSPQVNADSANGELRFAAASVTGGTGMPVIFNATFVATGTIGDSTLLSVVVDEMSAAGTLAPIANIQTTAIVCVGSVAGRWGDATGDDAVMSNDALAILTHAVGLSAPPGAAVNGDVDADGDADSRDALIVLSFAVALDVSAFRVNQLRPTLCGTGAIPATVVATPPSAVLRPGDQLPLTTVTRDAASEIIQTTLPGWLSLSPGVASVSVTGQVLAISNGTAEIVVAVAPGVADTVSIAVSGTQSVWYVNGAHSNAVEHGSAAYPFSTVAQALAAAGDDDTIRIAPAEYAEQLAVTRPLTVIGDTNALGALPIIRPTSGAAVDVAVTGSGGVILRRLAVPSTDGGIRARGAGGLLQLDSMAIDGTRSTALIARNFGSLVINATTIIGSTDAAIDADTIGAVTITGSSVDMVAGRSPGQPGSWVMRSANGTSFTVNNATVRGGRVETDLVSEVRISHAQLGDSHGPALRVSGADTIALLQVSMTGADSAAAILATNFQGDIHLDSIVARSFGTGIVMSGPRKASITHFDIAVVGGLGSNGLLFAAVDTVTVTNGRLEGGSMTMSPATYAGSRATLASLTVVGGRVDVATYERAQASLMTIEGGNDQALRFTGSRHVSVYGVEARQTRAQSFSGQAYAIYLSNVDTASLDSLWLHDNEGGAIAHLFGDTLGVEDSNIERNYLNPTTGQQGTLDLESIRRTRIVRTTIDGRAGAGVYGIYHVPSNGGSLDVDSTSIIGATYGVLSYASANDTIRVERSDLVHGGASGEFSVGLYANSYAYVSFRDNVVDSVTQFAVYLLNADHADVLDNQMTHTRDYGVYVQSTGVGPVDVSGNTISCVSSNNTTRGMLIANASVTVTGNSVQRCTDPINIVSTTGTPQSATIRQNVVTGDSAHEGGYGIFLSGRYVLPVVSLNTVSDGFWSQGAIQVGESFGYQIDSVRVDSNVVRRSRGNGIVAYGFLPGLQLRGNRVDSMRVGQGFDEAAIRLGHQTGGARLALDTLRGNRTLGILLETSLPDTVYIDSTIIVDDSTFAIRSYGSTPVAGFRNFIARNQYGLFGTSGTWRMNFSTIQQHALLGAYAGFAPWDLSNNYWGDPSGPRCDTCVGALGDSIEAVSNYLPFLTSPDGGTPSGVAGVASSFRTSALRGDPRRQPGSGMLRISPAPEPSAEVRAARAQAAIRAREEIEARQRAAGGTR